MTLPSNTNPEIIRLFVGIPLPDAIKHQLFSFQTLYTKLYGIRWVPVENLHITTLFIGKTDIVLLPEIKEKLENVISQTDPFQLQLEQFCYVPTQRPKMIWATFFKKEEFTHLVELVTGELSSFLSDTISHKEPIPHATIARIKKFKNFKAITFDPIITDDIVTVNECILWQSVLNSEGAKYTILETFSLMD